MGWNSWNKFQCDINEDMIREMADALVATGLRDAGYQYIVIDDCQDESATVSVLSSPSGALSLRHESPADYVHAQGLKIGIYPEPAMPPAPATPAAGATSTRTP